MDKTCSIVQDLLPLYEEDMLREETKKFVDGHLAQCAACRAELDALKTDVKPAPVSAQPLRFDARSWPPCCWPSRSR